VPRIIGTMLPADNPQLQPERILRRPTLRLEDCATAPADFLRAGIRANIRAGMPERSP
jgi:hypothetical protein